MKKLFLAFTLSMALLLCMVFPVSANQGGVDVSDLTEEQLHTLVFSGIDQTCGDLEVSVKVNFQKERLTANCLEETELIDQSVATILIDREMLADEVVEVYTSIAAADYTIDKSSTGQGSGNLMTVYAMVNYRLINPGSVDTRVEMINTKHKVVTAGAPIVNLTGANKMYRNYNLTMYENRINVSYPRGEWHTCNRPYSSSWPADPSTVMIAGTTADRGSIASMVETECVVEYYGELR